MRALSEAEIRGSFVNATSAELERFELPIEVLVAEWERLDALAWRDRRARRLGYLVTIIDDEPVGVVLRAAESTMSRHRAAICTLCHTQQPADQVTLFSARRAGPAGENGDSLGAYVCADLSCQENVRLHAPLAPAEVRDGWQALRRIEGLATRTRAFVADVRG